MIPWRDWLSFAVLTLGISPEAFWGLTLGDWRRLAPTQNDALDRRALNDLIDLYPDETP